MRRAFSFPSERLTGKLYHFPKSCEIRARIQSLHPYKLLLWIQQKSEKGKTTSSHSLPSSGAKPWGHTGLEQEASLDSKSMLGQLLDAVLALCEPPSACMEIRPWNLILFVSISRSAHTTFLGSLEWNQGCFSQSRFSHYPRMAQAPFMCCFSKGFCVPPWPASFPSLSKVEFPDGNPNYKHMVLLSATTLLAKGKKIESFFSPVFGIHFLSRGSFSGQKSDCQTHSWSRFAC